MSEVLDPPLTDPVARALDALDAALGELALRGRYARTFGRAFDQRDPQSFTERLFAQMLATNRSCDPVQTRLADKLLARDFVHLLDTAALFIGWLWPLWDPRNRTFADLLLRTEVRRVQPPDRDMRRFTAKVLAAVVVVCAALVASNYVFVYRDERAVDQARQQKKLLAETVT